MPGRYRRSDRGGARGIGEIEGASSNKFCIYFAGHGISEGIPKTSSPFPARLLLDDTYDRMDAAELGKHTLYAGALVDELESFKVPFVVVLDTCYQGNERSFDSAVLSKTASKIWGQSPRHSE